MWSLYHLQVQKCRNVGLDCLQTSWHWWKKLLHPPVYSRGLCSLHIAIPLSPPPPHFILPWEGKGTVKCRLRFVMSLNKNFKWMLTLNTEKLVNNSCEVFLVLYSKSFNDRSLKKNWLILFPENLSVSQGKASGNIEIFRKIKLLFWEPSHHVICNTAQGIHYLNFN